MDVCSPIEGPPRKSMRLDHHDDSPGRSRSGTVDVDPQSLAATSLRNPTDALNLLALAADVDRASKSKNKNGKNKNKRRADGRSVAERDEGDIGLDLEFESTPIADDTTGHGVEQEQTSGASGHGSRASLYRPHPKSPSPPSLGTFELIKQNILNQNELSHLTSLFFLSCTRHIPYDVLQPHSSHRRRACSLCRRRPAPAHCYCRYHKSPGEDVCNPRTKLESHAGGYRYSLS